jgi:hypothetical protein
MDYELAQSGKGKKKSRGEVDVKRAAPSALARITEP